MDWGDSMKFYSKAMAVSLAMTVASVSAQAKTFTFVGDIDFNNVYGAGFFGVTGTTMGTFTALLELDDTLTPTSDGVLTNTVATSNFGYTQSIYTHAGLTWQVGDKTWTHNAGFSEGDVFLALDGNPTDYRFAYRDQLTVGGESDYILTPDLTVFDSSFRALEGSGAVLDGTGVDQLYKFNQVAAGINNGIIRFRDLSQDPQDQIVDFNLSNIRLVEQVSGVPEPSTWLMMIIGFGLVGVASRSRKILHRV